MIFFANAEGTITQSINTPINQGSNGANEVVLICPFSATFITARYILPNGEITRPYPMVKYGTASNGLYAYRALLDGAVTRKSGTVTVQFTLWNGGTLLDGAVNGGTQLSTVSTSFFVNKGVPDIPMYNGEDELLKDIFENLSLLEQEITYNVIREYNLGDNNDIGEYQIVFNADGYKEAPAVYNNFKITYDNKDKVGTLFVFAKVVEGETHQNEILYVGDEVYTRLITIGEATIVGDWVRSVDQELDKDSTRAISNKAVFEEFESVKSRLSTAESEIPIVIDEVLDLPNNSNEITVGYTNSIDAGSLNRAPKQGETAAVFCKTRDNAFFSAVLQFVDKDINDDGYYNFEVTEVLLIHKPLDKELSLTSTNAVENRAVAEKFADVETSLDAVREIAQGKQTGYVFDTKADMETALADAEFVAKLKAGDDLFIKEQNQPDYWWTDEEALEAEGKTDLDNYYNKQEIDARRSVQNITHLDTIYANESELPLTAENGTCVVVGSDGVFSLWAYYTGVTGEPTGWKYKYPVRASTIYCVLKKNGQPYNKLLRFTMAAPYFLELSSTKVEQIVKDGTPIAKITVDGEETTIFGAANNSKTITLLSNNWSNNNQTVVFDGLTLSSFVFISPVGNPSAYAEAGIYCSAQGVGSLSFSCENTPSTDIEVNVFVMG